MNYIQLNDHSRFDDEEWEVTRCRDVNGIEYEMPIPKDLFLRKIGVKN